MYWFTTILILPYLISLLKIYRSLTKIKPFHSTENQATFVSVVVACRNEEKNLPNLLNCILAQDYPKEMFELIVVNDNSTDRSPEIASTHSDSINTRVINNIGRGKKQALRSGIFASSGSLIITTDADCIMGEKWIRTIASFFEKESPDIIICPVQLKKGNGFFSRFQELEFLSLQGITAGSAFAGASTMCNGANLSFRRQAYLKHFAYINDDIASGDDIFLLHSIKSDPDSKILWLESPDAMVKASSSKSIMMFLKQRRRWISKGKSYKDLSTIHLAIVTFVTISLQVFSFTAGLINLKFWLLYLVIFILKSIPDLLILLNTTLRYSRRSLMNWYLPSQLLYPFYVLGVIIFSMLPFRKTGH